MKLDHSSKSAPNYWATSFYPPDEYFDRVDVAGAKFALAHSGAKERLLQDVLEVLPGLPLLGDYEFRKSWRAGLVKHLVSTTLFTYHARVRINKRTPVISAVQEGKSVDLDIPHPHFWSEPGLSWLLASPDLHDRS